MKIKNVKSYLIKAFSLLLTVVMFALNVKLTPKNSNDVQDTYIDKSDKPIVVSPTGTYVKNHVFHSGEMRAVWIPYMTLDMSDTDRSEKAFKNKIDGIIKTSLNHGINTLVVHVRSHCDAIYKSKYFPYSHILSGKQGQSPDYDALDYIVSACHRAGLEIHAWINPFRIKTDSTPGKLSSDNPYNIWKNDDDTSNDRYAVKWENGLYLNPAYPAVRELIINGVREIVENYDVDGIHFDDYFYPTSDSEFDKAEYNAYLKTLDDDAVPLTLSRWRLANVNSLIAGVYSAVKREDKSVVFGISPQGNMSNDKNISADIESWAKFAGFTDYLCPQIYVNFEHPLLPFDKTCDEWRELVVNSETRLYCGLALYKAGSDRDEGTWQTSDDILKRELEYLRNCGYEGFMIYSYDYLEAEQTALEVKNFLSALV